MHMRFIVTGALALALAGCGSSEQPAAAASDAPAAATAETAPPAPGAPAAAAGKGDKPSKEFVVGKWGTDGDCALAMDLRADGTSDGPFGNWTYADGVLGFAEAPDMKINVTVIDQNTMESTNDSGKPRKMTRCP